MRRPKLRPIYAILIAGSSFAVAIVFFLWGVSKSNAADELEAEYATSYRYHRVSGSNDNFALLLSESGNRPTMTVIRYESELDDLRIGANLLKELSGAGLFLAFTFVGVTFLARWEQKQSS